MTYKTWKLAALCVALVFALSITSCSDDDDDDGGSEDASTSYDVSVYYSGTGESVFGTLTATIRGSDSWITQLTYKKDGSTYYCSIVSYSSDKDWTSKVSGVTYSITITVDNGTYYYDYEYTTTVEAIFAGEGDSELGTVEVTASTGTITSVTVGDEECVTTEDNTVWTYTSGTTVYTITISESSGSYSYTYTSTQGGLSDEEWNEITSSLSNNCKITLERECNGWSPFNPCRVHKRR